jgi:signal transduction histidine kinase
VAVLAATDARDLLREQVLSFTSELRNGIDALAADPADPNAVETMQRATRSFNQLAGQNGLQSLVRSGSVLERIPAVADALRWAQPDEIPSFLAGANDVLGTIEELLDWCLEEADPTRQQRLTGSLHRSFPERWRRLLEADSDAFERQLKSLTRPAAAPRPAPAPPRPPAPGATSRSTVAAPARPSAPKVSTCNIPAELLETFQGEATERLQRCEELLVQLEHEPEKVDNVHALLRELHTLKGAAAEVGLDLVREQVHDGESLLALMRDGRAAVEPSQLVDFFFRLLDSVRGILDQAGGRTDSTHAVIDDVAGEIAKLLGQQAQTGGAVPDPDAATDLEAAGGGGAPLADIAKLRERLGAAAQDPEVLRLIESLDRQARQYSQMAVGFKEELDRLRLMPLDDIFRRLLRPVRDAARREEKRVHLKLHGGETRVDREVGEHLHGCLLHLVRNAVSHGIELPVVREAAGKSPVGTVRVSAQIEGEYLVLAVQDDGAGLDYEAILAQAAANGWVDPARRPSSEELARFIFQPGFSTRTGVDDLAGRGVGMDAVAREVERLGGRIDIESSQDEGTCFRLTLPLRSVAGGAA